MKRHLLIAGALSFCFLLNGQKKSNERIERELNIKLRNEWFNHLKTNLDGDNWTFKTVDELLGRTKSPYFKIGEQVMQMDVPVQEQRRPGSLLVVDMSNNNMSGEMLAGDKIWTYEASYSNGGTYETGRFYGTSDFIFSYNNLTKVNCKLIYGGAHYNANKIFFDHNKLTEFNPKPDDAGNTIVGSPGAKNIRLNNNYLSEVPDSWTIGYRESMNFIRYNVDTFRIENNIFNFEQLIRLNTIIQNKRNSLNETEPPAHFKFVYAPQRPLGDESEVTLAAGEKKSLSFSLNHADNKYSWELNGKAIPLSEGKNYDVTVGTESAGVYRCKVTNAKMPELTIYSKDMIVFLDKPSNNAPTSVAITNSSVPRKSPQWSVIGQLGGEDPDGDQLYFRLTNCDGDNGCFRIIDGNTLVSSTNLFEYSYKTEYNIEVEAYDIYGGRLVKQLTISQGASTTPVPTSMAIDNAVIDENTLGKVGSFVLGSVDMANYSFSLPAAKDNHFFEVSGADLMVKEFLNYEKKEFYIVRVTAQSNNGDVAITKDFQITATDINDAPENLSITNNTINVGQDAGTLVGVLVATDEDPDDFEIKYEVVSDYFTLRKGNEVRNKVKFTNADIGIKKVMVKATDKNKLSADFSVDIEVKPEPIPAEGAVALSNYTVRENYKGLIGKLSFSQPGSYTFALVNGEGAENNDMFTIKSTSLELNSEVNYEAVKSLNLRVKATKGSVNVETKLTVIVQNINEAPGLIGLTGFNIAEDAKVGDVVCQAVLKDEDGDTGTFTVEGSDYLEFKGDDLVMKKDADKQMYTVKITGSDGEFEVKNTFYLVGTAPNHAPEAIGLSNFILGSDWAAGTEVATLFMKDVDAGTGKFSLGSGADNAYFTINGDVLEISKSLEGHTNKFTITVTATDDSGESVTEDFDLYIPTECKGTDIIEVSGGRISAYPNPVSGSVTVELPEYRGDVSVKLFNMRGDILYTDNIIIEDADQQYNINMSGFKQGVYTLKIEGENINSAKQLIKL